MPDLDGTRFAEAIKDDPATRGAMVVMLTSIGSWRQVRRMEGGSIDACLVKPVRQSQLLQALTGAWARQSARSLAALAENVGEGRKNPQGAAPARVLVADDSVVKQRVAVRRLENLGMRADVAANGREVLEMLP